MSNIQNTSEMVVTKGMVELYKVRPLKPYNGMLIWADIIVHDTGHNSGRITISSMYDNWQCYFDECGIDFKQFLIGLEKQYLADKFLCNKQFNFKGTLEHYKSEVNKALKEKIITPYLGEIILKEIKDIDENILSEHEIAFAAYIQTKAKHLLEFFGYTPQLIRTINFAFSDFWEQIWPHFIEHLKKELADEESAQSFYDHDKLPPEKIIPAEEIDMETYEKLENQSTDDNSKWKHGVVSPTKNGHYVCYEDNVRMLLYFDVKKDNWLDMAGKEHKPGKWLDK